MTAYVVGVEGASNDPPEARFHEDGPVHIWTGNDDPWPAMVQGGEYDAQHDRPPAACGREHVAAWCKSIDKVFDSLADYARADNACPGCAAAISDRHNLPVEVEA